MAVINGSDKSETIDGTTAADIIRGLAGNDTLNGYGAADLLDGGTGNDIMRGGGGWDTYYVDSVDDQVIERLREGRDEVRTTLDTHTLAANVENLTYLGAGKFEGRGNVLDNAIVGGNLNDFLSGDAGRDRLCGLDGCDFLDGGSADDILVGGRGNDIYRVDDDGDRVVELGRQGTDLVLTTLDSYALGGNLENLSYEGKQSFAGTGNALRNIIGGGLSNDILTGGGGNDRLFGGGGTDTAVFAGKQSDYTITVFGGVATVVDNDALLDGDDGTDTLYDIGRLQFADGVVSIKEPASLNLAYLDGANGFRLIGVDANDGSGISVSSAGDVNGDGFEDLIVGADQAEDATGATSEGESYVVFGKANWSGAPTFDLATLNGGNGFRLIGVDENDRSGFSVSLAGDVNGDGFTDLIVGALDAGADVAGESYVVFGKGSWSGMPALDLAALDGTNGFALLGSEAFDSSGFSVSSAGDVNGDGLADVIVGAPGAPLEDGGRHSYVVFGKAQWAGTPSFNLADLDGTNGFRLTGSEAYTGRSVSSAGDVNGDGFDDVVVGASAVHESPAGMYEIGESYVVFGKSDWAGTPSFDFSALNGTNGFRVVGVDEGDDAGSSVSSAGDVNGDGFDDLIVGAPRDESPSSSSREGESYVVFGKADWALTPSYDLANLDGTNGFRLTGIDSNDRSGHSVSSAGDVNGDGFSDLIIGAPGAESENGGDNAGESYVVYGKAEWSDTPALGLTTLNGINGFSLIGIDADDDSGHSVSSAGDVNGDGFADVIVGAPGAESTGGSSGEGESYIVFGGNFSGQPTPAETIIRGAGNDLILIESLDFFRIDGGTGTDTLSVISPGLHLDLTSVPDNRITSIERLSISGAGTNTLTLGVRDVLNMSENSNELWVMGDPDDILHMGLGWTKATSGGTNGDGTSTIPGIDELYQIYTAGQAVLLAETDIGQVSV
jgi:hypothetical protein